MPVIIVERGPNKGQRISLKAGQEISVGTAPAAKLRVEDPLVSEHHCTFKGADGAWWLADEDSRNGTWLNGEAVEEETALKPGDQVEIGETVLSFAADSESKKIADPLVGTNVGGYRIIERVGRGGMGVVYKATQLSLNREVALKILGKKFVQDQTFIKMFVEEARSAAALNHPNIVQAYDVGKAKDTYYFSMEYMGGGSVQDILAKEGRIQPGKALAMMINAAKGLEFAEKKRIVHCDIKPDNLMLTEDGTVKIGDLGLSKNLQKDGKKGDNQVFGTPHFVAPEQVQGKPLDHRTDLYSLGASFFRMVSGRTPFTGETARELVMKHLKEPVPTLPSIDPDIPKELDAIVQRLMQKDPGDRYQTSNDLVLDLRKAMVAVGADGGYTDLIPGLVEGQRKGRVGMLIGLGVGVLAVIIAVLAIAFSGNGETGMTPEQIAEQARLRKEKEEIEAARREEGAAADAYEHILAEEARLKDPTSPDIEKVYQRFVADFPNSRWAAPVKKKLDAIPGLRSQKDVVKCDKAWTVVERKYIDGKKPGDPKAEKAVRGFIAEWSKVATEKKVTLPALAKARAYLEAVAKARSAGKQREQDASAAYEPVAAKTGTLVGERRFGAAREALAKFDAKKWNGTGAATSAAQLAKDIDKAQGVAFKAAGEKAKRLEDSGQLETAAEVWDEVAGLFGDEKAVAYAKKEAARLRTLKDDKEAAALRALVAREMQQLGAVDRSVAEAVQEYRFGEALAAYLKLRDGKQVTTQQAQAALTARVKDFGIAQRAMEALIALCNTESANPREFDLPERAGKGTGRITGASERGLDCSYKLGGQRRISTRISWDKFTPAELMAVFHKHVPGAPVSALQRAVLALIWRMGDMVNPALDEAARSPDAEIKADVEYYRGRLASGPLIDAAREAAAQKLRDEARDLYDQAQRAGDPEKERQLLARALELLQRLKAKYPNTKAAKGR